MPKARLIKKVANVLPPRVFEVATSVYQFGRNMFLADVKVPEGDLPEKKVNAYYRTRKFGPRKKICYAPFNNLYFAIDGRVMACCYNRDVPLGHYPNQTIKDIWTGDEANKLRERIEAFDLGGGCTLCKEQLLAGDYASVMASKYDYQAEEGPQYPTRFDFELSNTCNLECIMCSGEFSSSIRKNREGKEPIISPYGKDFLAQLDEFIPHLKVANFLGGEPFLIDIYYSIWDKIIAINPDCEIRLQTNATILNERVKKLLAKGNFHIGISIDSFDNTVYESIRVNANYERVMQHIQYFAEYARTKDTFLTLSFCPLRSNWQELPDVLAFANKNGALLNINTVVQPAVQSLWTMSNAELNHIISTLTATEFTLTTYFEKHNQDVFNGFVKQVQVWADMAAKREAKMKDLALVVDAELLPMFFAQLDGVFADNIQSHNDDFSTLLTGFKNTITQLVDVTAGDKKHTLLLKLNTLPVEWLKHDTEIFDSTKFLDKVKDYLLE